MVSVDDYNEFRDCVYKDEHYSVRDNGAIMRYPREEREMWKRFEMSRNALICQAVKNV